MSARASLIVFSLGAVTVTACGDDPVTYSAPVGINLKAKSEEVNNTGAVISEEKGITTEEGNPYGKFLNGALAALAQQQPSRIEVAAATLVLGGKSKDVTKLEEVLAGSVEVLFIMDSTKNTFPVARTTDPQGGGPVNLQIVFDGGAVAGEDLEKLRSGSFKVVVRGDAGTVFAGGNKAEADLQVTFTFEAYR